MKKKQFMSKLAALTIAATMTLSTGVPVFAAGVTGYDNKTNKEATTGLVQTSNRLSEDLVDAYAAWDSSAESEVAKLNKAATFATINSTITSVSVSNVTVTKNGDTKITRKPTGTTASTCGVATVPVTFTYTTGTDVMHRALSITGSSLTNHATPGTYTYDGTSWKNDDSTTLDTTGLTIANEEEGDSITVEADGTSVTYHDAADNTIVKTPAKKVSQNITLTVYFGSRQQAAMSDAKVKVEQRIKAMNGSSGDLKDPAEYLNTKGAFDADGLKETPISITNPTSGDLQGYTYAAKVTKAHDYTAATSTAAASYKVDVEITVNGHGNGETDPEDELKETATYTISLEKLPAVDRSSATVKAITTGSAEISAPVLGKKYPIVVNAQLGTASAADLTATELTAYGFTFKSSDSSVAEVVDDEDSASGKSLEFKKFGKVKVTATTPYGASTTDQDSKARESLDVVSTEYECKDDNAFASVLDELDKKFTQADITDETTAKTALEARIKAAYSAAYGKDYNINVKIDDISAFKAAVAGTAEDKDGTDGSFVASYTVTNYDEYGTTLNTVQKKDVAFSITATPYTAKFTDVADTDYFAKAVAWGVDKDIVAGTTDTTFSPKADVTRAQFVTFLYRQAGSPDVEINKTFTDISGLSDEFQKAISWAAATGVTDGVTDTTFAPNATVNREQAVTFLFRYTKGEATTKTASFKDVDSSAYYADAVNWGAENGVVEGYNDDTFGVNRSTNRGEAITFIYRALAD